MAKQKKSCGRPKNKSNHEVYAELKEKRNRKRKILPGFWTKINTSLEVQAKLQKHISDFGPPCIGKYITHDDGYKGDGYRALVKVTVTGLKKLLYEHGIDEVLAACEKSLNSYTNKKGKKVLGDLVIHQVQQEKLDSDPPCIICMIKTNKNHIPKFMGFKRVKDESKPKLTVF